MLKLPFKRNWFEEALAIANGKNIKPKKEHIQAVVQQHALLAQKTEKLVSYFEKQHGGIIDKRKEELNAIRKITGPKGTC